MGFLNSILSPRRKPRRDTLSTMQEESILLNDAAAVPTTTTPHRSISGRNHHSLLPMTTHLASGQASCTSFLMGGAYYPGKDKNFRHMRRRTFKAAIWYRICWSTNFRRVCSVIASIYLILHLILFPLGDLIYHYGRLLSSTSNSSTLATSSQIEPENSPTNPSFQKTKQLMQHLQNQLEISKRSDSKRSEIRHKIMKEIAPQFYPGEKDNEEHEQHSNGQSQHDTIPDPAKQDLQNDELHISTMGDDDHSSVTDIYQKFLRRLNQNQDGIVHHSQCDKNIDEAMTPTLVLQGTLDRLPVIHMTCNRWKHAPIVLVLYITPSQEEERWSEIVLEYEATCPHLKLVPYVATSEDERRHAYPINKLRNIGLDHVKTSHVLVLDLDFTPSQGLDQVIQASLEDFSPRNNDAIVIPAFERTWDLLPCTDVELCLLEHAKDENFIPTSTSNLLQCIVSEKCDIFQRQIKPQGHYDTGYERWMRDIRSNSTSMYEIKCFSSMDYEPYVVLPWCPLTSNRDDQIQDLTSPISPYYDERFHGYGKNKIQMTSHLRYLGFHFYVLPAAGFITHVPHPASETKSIWMDQNETLHHDMDQLYGKFMEELQTLYRESNHRMTQLCKRNRWLKSSDTGG